LRGKLGPVDISAIAGRIEALLDEKIEGVAITAPIIEGDEASGRVDLSNIDFEKLASLFAGKPRTAAERLREAVEKKAMAMVERNPTRVSLVEKLEKLVETYNLGTLDVEAFFQALRKLVAEMEEEERRAAREGLSEEELAVFDLLTRPEPKLTKSEEVAVKQVARDLFLKLREHLSVKNWRIGQETRGVVESTIRFTLNELPEEPYPEPLWVNKVDAVWAYIFSRKDPTDATARL
jgi:type I restriction enzyme R subunit